MAATLRKAALFIAFLAGAIQRIVGLELAMFYRTSYETQASHLAQLAFGLSTDMSAFFVPLQWI